MRKLWLMGLLLSVCSLLWFAHSTSAQAEHCNPPVSGVRFDGQSDADVSSRINRLYVEDQSIRQPDEETDLAQMIADDQARREEAMKYLQAGQVIKSWDLFNVALIFQHGDCSEHYKLAAELAQRARDRGHISGAWLYAAATDRYLLSIGQPQRYGTQYAFGLDERLHLCPVVAETTDETRTEFGLPSLQALHTRAEELTEQFPLEEQFKSRWRFLTDLPVIGAVVNQGVLIQRCSQY